MKSGVNGVFAAESKRNISKLVENKQVEENQIDAEFEPQWFFSLESHLEDKNEFSGNTFNEDCGDYITKINRTLDAMNLDATFKLLLQFGIYLQKSIPGVRYDNIVEKLANKESEFHPSKPFYNQNQVKEAVKIPDLKIIYFLFEGSEKYQIQMGSSIGKISQTILNSVRIALNAHHTLLLDEEDTYSAKFVAVKAIFEKFEENLKDEICEVDMTNIIQLLPMLPRSINKYILQYTDPSEGLLKLKKESCNEVYHLYKETSNKYIKEFLSQLNLNQFQFEITELKKKVMNQDFLKDIVRLSIYVFLDEKGQIHEKLIPIISDFLAKKTFIVDQIPKGSSFKAVCEETDNLTTVMKYLSRLLLKIVADGNVKDEELLIEMQQNLMNSGFIKKILIELEIERKAVKQFLSTYVDLQNIESLRINAIYELNKACKDINSRFELNENDFESFLLVFKDIKTEVVLSRYLTYIGEIYPGLLKNIFDMFMIHLSEQFAKMVEFGDKRIINDPDFLGNFENKFLKICDLLVLSKQTRIVEQYLETPLSKSMQIEKNLHDHFRSVFRQIIVSCSDGAKSNIEKRNIQKLIASPKAAAFFGTDDGKPSPTGVYVSKIAFSSPRSGQR